MQGQLIQMLMNQLKAKNPQMFQLVEEARRNQKNPKDLFREITSKNSPEQMQSFYKQAEQLGFSPDLLNELKK